MTLAAIAQWVGYIVTIGGFLLALVRVLRNMNAVVEGQRSLLRSEIMKTYYRHCDEEDPTLREYERKSLDALYSAYEKLRGNSFVSDIYNDQMRHWHVVS